MKVLLLATIATLLWCALTTDAMLCDPDQRYVVPQNCSAFILCDEQRNPRIFPCPHGLHYNPMKKCCDWPKNVQCTLEDSQRGTSGEGRVGETTKTIVEVKNVTFAHKSKAMKTESEQNKMKKVKKEELVESKEKFGETEVKSNIRRISLKVKSNGGIVKENINNDKTVVTDDRHGKLSSIKNKNEDKLDVKLDEEKLLDQPNVQEKPRDEKYLVNEPGVIEKLLHSLRKREDKEANKTEETKKEGSASNNGKLDKQIGNKNSSVEGEKSVKVETKYVTLKEATNDSKIFTESESELIAFKQSLIEFIMNMDPASFRPGNGKPETIYSSEDEMFIPVQFDAADPLGYETDISDPKNSTSETNQNETKNEKIFTTDNAPSRKNEQTTTEYEAPTSTNLPTSEQVKKA